MHAIIWLLAFMMPTVSFGSTSVEGMDIIEFSKAALNYDENFQDARLDEQVAQIRKNAANNLFRAKLTLSPYIERYEHSTDAYSFNEKGFKAAYSQYLPTGTTLTFAYDHAWENTLASSQAQENSYKISLSQPLWNNFFGQADRDTQKASALNAEALRARSNSAMLETCANAATLFISAWTEEQRTRFVKDVFVLASELQSKTEPAFKSGQLGKLDWWAVQTEFLGLQDQHNQAQIRLQSLNIELAKKHPLAVGRALKDPSAVFAKMLSLLKEEQKTQSTFAEEYLVKLTESQRMKKASEKSLAHPELNFELSHIQGDGRLSPSNYDDKDLTLALNLIWKLNDDSVRAAANVAHVEAERALFKNQQMQRTRADRFKQSLLELRSQQQQIEIEKKRVQLLSQITNENKRRFLQGRIDFQYFLRVKEQWFDSQIRLLEKQSNFWKNLITFAFTENLSTPFCTE